MTGVRLPMALFTLWLRKKAGRIDFISVRTAPTFENTQEETGWRIKYFE